MNIRHPMLVVSQKSFNLVYEDAGSHWVPIGVVDAQGIFTMLVPVPRGSLNLWLVRQGSCSPVCARHFFFTCQQSHAACSCTMCMIAHPINTSPIFQQHAMRLLSWLVAVEQVQEVTPSEERVDVRIHREYL